MSLIAINPVNGEKLKEYGEPAWEQVVQKIEQAYKTWLTWRKTSHDQRSWLLLNMANVLRNRSEEFAILMACEMGKPVKQGRDEIEKCALCCEYFALKGPAHLADQIIATGASKSFVTFQPLGIVLAIMPWNFPFWQVFRFLAPALAAGNCGMLKHASNVPGCALAIEEIVKEAGFPPYVFQTLLINSAMVEKIIEHPLIKAVTLTGSINAGRQVAQKAASMIKKTVLELGGSDAYIVLEDADVEYAAETCVNSRIINSGQSCVAAKRFIVVESALKEFTSLFYNKMRAKKVGDPLDPSTDIGPLARQDLRDQLHNQVETSIKNGAKCILGGEIPEGNNAFYPATILTNVRPGMPAYEEELFGPVAAIIAAIDEDDAIRIANDSVFGLGAAIFTIDVKKGERIAAKELQAGFCNVNHPVQSDPRLPFGGINQSGYGRELGEFGIREFVNIKTVYIK
jgi:succinate-semialdehyde dehydrogenase / glutarate-semialdehyde dehydrogenase